MKFFKYSIMALAMAAAFASCDDDNKYVEGPQSPGAYFPTNAASIVELPTEGNVVYVPVERMTLESPSVYPLVAEDESGLFTFPTEVVFEANELTAQIPVIFEEDWIETDAKYPVTLTLEGASTYGDQTYSFSFCRVAPLIIEDKTGLFFSDMWNGTPWDIKIQWGVNENDPAIVQVRLTDLFEEIAVLNIDMHTPFADGTYPVTFETVFTGVSNSDGYDIYWSTLLNFYLLNEFTYEEIEQSHPNYITGCNFNAQTGLITLATTYTLPDKGPAYWFSEMTEYIQLDGYPVYDIEVEYTGLSIDRKGRMSSNCAVTCGADVKEVWVANAATADYEAVIAGMQDGSYAYETLKGSTDTQTVSFPVTEAGTYTVVALSIDAKGAIQQFDYDTYKITIGAEDPNKGWTSLGTGSYTDGVNGPMYMEVYNAAAVTWDVEIQQKDDQPGVYRVVDPYNDESPFAGVNEDDEDGYLMIDCTNPSFITVPAQAPGFTDDWGVLTIKNYEWNFLQQTDDINTIINYMAQNGLPQSTFKNGVITINYPLFNTSKHEPDKWYYSKYPIIITLPGGNKPKGAAAATAPSFGAKANHSLQAVSKYSIAFRAPALK